MAGIAAPRTVQPAPTNEPEAVAPTAERTELWDGSGLIIGLILAGVIFLLVVGIGAGMLTMIAQTVLGTAR